MTNDETINLKLPSALKVRFRAALDKRMQSQAAVLRRAIEQYCEEADRMGTPKNIKP
jgi:predicted DNA-binding protein